jgi:hypothetical protein
LTLTASTCYFYLSFAFTACWNLVILLCLEIYSSIFHLLCWASIRILYFLFNIVSFLLIKKDIISWRRKKKTN